MTRNSGAVFGIVGGALGVVLGGLIIFGSRQSQTSLSGHPGLTLGLWFILAGSLAVLITVVGSRQAFVRGLGLLACVVIGSAGLMSLSSQEVHKDYALLVWLIAGIPMIVGAVLALRDAARHDEPAATLPVEPAAPQPPAETAAEPTAGLCSQCGAPLPSAELTFCPNCAAERVSAES